MSSVLPKLFQNGKVTCRVVIPYSQHFQTGVRTLPTGKFIQQEAQTEA